MPLNTYIAEDEEPFPEFPEHSQHGYHSTVQPNNQAHAMKFPKKTEVKRGHRHTCNDITPICKEMVFIVPLETFLILFLEVHRDMLIASGMPRLCYRTRSWSETA